MPITRASASPLRYPGSKAVLVEYISNLLKQESLLGCTFIEPYAGSAVVSIELLRQEDVKNAIIVERDPLIYAFWYCVFFETDLLLKRIYDTPVTIETWKLLLPLRDIKDVSKADVIDLGFAGFFYNRTNFSGILKANPLGGINQSSSYKIDCRFNKISLIEKIKNLATLANRITVVFGDGLSHSKLLVEQLRDQRIFIYVDPPYFQKGSNLYRYWFSYEDHAELAKWLLSQEIPWLASYDYHDKIMKLYSEKHRQEINFDYWIGNENGKRKGKELLISNLHIPPAVKLFKSS